MLRGEGIAVDEICMRDRSWGSRPDHLGGCIGYTCGADRAGNGFCAFAQWKKSNTSGGEAINHGFLLHGGERRQLREGWRYVDRDRASNRILRIGIEAEDVSGRAFRAEGHVQSHMMLPYPRGVTCTSLLKWSFNGGEARGEDQYVWRYHQWRAAVLDLRGRK